MSKENHLITANEGNAVAVAAGILHTLISFISLIINNLNNSNKGYHLATGKNSMVIQLQIYNLDFILFLFIHLFIQVYLQNSGIGNIVNPIMSLAG